MKKIIITTLSLLIFVSTHAQNKVQYMHFSIGEGIHNFSYSLQNGTEKAKSGFTINAAYSYFFTSDWGLQTGLGLQSYNTLSTLNYLSTTPDVIDAVGDSYEFRNNYKNWQEKQQALFIDIPIEAQYRHFFTSKLGILASGGMKISVPVHASYKTVGGEMVITGYYSKWNVLLSDLPQHGFGTYADSYGGNISLKPAYIAIADLGVLYKLSENLDFYIGAYINYGLNSVITVNSKFVYQPDGAYNGLFGSDQVNMIKPIALGVKIGFYWRMIKNHRKTEPKELNGNIILDSVTVPIKQFTISQTDQSNNPVAVVNAKELVKLDTVNNNSLSEISIKKQELQTNSEEDKSLIGSQNIVGNNSRQVSETLKIATQRAKQIAGSIKLNYGYETALQLLGAKNDKISALSTVLKENPELYLTFVSRGDSISIDVNSQQDKYLKNKEIDNVVSTDSLPKKESAVSIKTLEEVNQIAMATKIRFYFNSINFYKNGRNIKNMMILSNILIANPHYCMTIVGYTDNIGSYYANLMMGIRRSICMLNIFRKYGVPDSQIKTESRAYDNPKVPNTSARNRAKNRRVEIQVNYIK